MIVPLGRHLFPALVTIVALALMAACSSDSGGAAADPPGASSTSTRPTAAPDDDRNPAVDWSNGSDGVAVGDGWVAVACPAGPRLLCIEDAGRTLGIVELVDYPVASFANVARVLSETGSTEQALEQQAVDFVDTFVEDRALGCGERYDVVARDPAPASVGGRDGLTYGFDATLDGEPVERTVQWATIEGDSIFIVSVSAMEVGTCADDAELDDLDLAQLAAIEGDLAEIVANSELPEPQLCMPPEGDQPVGCHDLSSS